jgi:integrase/recombinase XerD
MDLLSTSDLFQEFLTERRYLKNVTPSTIEWYETAWTMFRRGVADDARPLSKSVLQTFVVTLRQRNVRPVSCNTYIKALNAFCRWLHEEGHTPERLALPLLRVEKRIIQTLTDEQIQTLLSAKPKRFDQWRLHALVCLLLDTGLRIEEGLTLQLTNVDFDNLLITAFGKGRKERRNPFSSELRKVLYRYQQIRAKERSSSDLLFPTREGTRWDRRNSLRGLYLLQDKFALPRFGWHRLRHTFATNYLRHRGDIVRLSMVLGHTQITTTQRYLHLLTDDLTANHQRVSILNRLT